MVLELKIGIEYTPVESVEGPAATTFFLHFIPTAHHHVDPRGVVWGLALTAINICGALFKPFAQGTPLCFTFCSAIESFPALSMRYTGFIHRSGRIDCTCPVDPRKQSP